MKRSILFGLLGCIAAFTVTTASAVKPVSYVNPQVSFTNVPFLDCTQFGFDFWVMANWTYNEYGRLHFDDQGNIVRLNGFFYLGDPLSWNSEDPSKVLTADDFAGTGEHIHFVVKFDSSGADVYYKEVGISFRTVVPGQGAIVLNAGMMEFEWDGAAWILTKLTPNRTSGPENDYLSCELHN